MSIKVKLIGKGGRMGSRVVSLLQENTLFSLEDSIQNADVIIDFSSPLALQQNLAQVLLHKKPLVIGTTGHSPENLTEINKASLEIPILFSPNFSIALAACLEAVSIVSHLLKTACSVEIIEKHHLNKKDSPSGTALALANCVKLADSNKELAIHSFREGEVIGEHKIIFRCPGEKIEISHSVDSRDVFARGALKAGHFLTEQPAGLYTIKDLFNVYSH